MQEKSYVGHAFISKKPSDYGGNTFTLKIV